MKLELQATPEEVMRAVETLQDLGRNLNIGERDLFGLALALEECGSNIVNHALRGDPQRKFQVDIHHTGDAVTIELRDDGPEFDPTQARAKASAVSDDDRPPGGWGILLVRRYMDEMHYHRDGAENVLRLTKFLPGLGGKNSFAKPGQTTEH